MKYNDLILAHLMPFGAVHTNRATHPCLAARRIRREIERDRETVLKQNIATKVDFPAAILPHTRCNAGLFKDMIPDPGKRLKHYDVHADDPTPRIRPGD
jgi:hypothetical protein